MLGQQHYDVVIAGAGPVGLFMALRLSQLGLNYLILEKRHVRFTHSRSIGIHPPSLEMLDQLNISDQLIKQGVRIEEGHAYQDQHTVLGTLNFKLCPKPHCYVLSIPQHQTESILENALPDHKALKKGFEIITFNQYDHSIQIDFKDEFNSTQSVEASYLVGCDGKNSTVRKKAGITFQGDIYPYHYAMGDYKDDTQFGSRAAIFLSGDGLVESFPLPGNKRRWVTELQSGYKECAQEKFLQIIQERTGYNPNPLNNSTYSTFIAEHFLASRFYFGRVFLAGDSAHIVSPIGGQGMNLGWLNAWHLANAMAIARKNEMSGDIIFKTWEKQRMKSAEKAIKRAEFNMALGQKSNWPRLRGLTIKRLLRYPFNRAIANRFTMRGLN
ncbi:MAG: NAD(P)/FAD-dependent oxidoreductase [Balneolales bacterium]